MLQNDTFLRALRREPTPHTPVWLMRQAGRYLPEYNATRAKAGSFMALAQNPALATEVTLQPLDRFPLDAAILFSDILTVPDAMGLGLSFAEGEGPRFARTGARRGGDARAGGARPGDQLRYVFDAVAQIKRALKGRVPLIGFAGSPFTLACYMIEGGGSDDFATVRKMAYAAARPPRRARRRQRARGHRIPRRADRRQGADAVMIFDTWGGTAPRATPTGDSRWRRCATIIAGLAPARTAAGAVDRVHARAAAAGSTDIAAVWRARRRARLDGGHRRGAGERSAAASRCRATSTRSRS